MAEHVPPAPASVISYASSDSGSGRLWRLFRVGLILWASVTLLRHGLYWTSRIGIVGDTIFVDTWSGSDLRIVGFAAIECVLLILFLIAAVHSPRGTRQRFAVLGGLGAAFAAVVLIGALLDLLSSNFPGSARIALRSLWTFVSRLQVAVVPLMCLIGLVCRVGDE